MSSSLSETKILGPRDCPVAVALDRVDLAVVRKKPKRLRQPPLGQRVRREALVENANR